VPAAPPPTTTATRPAAAGGGTELRPVTLTDKYTATQGTVLISGIEALVRLTLDQRRLDRRRGLNTAVFVSGYEGSPLGGLDLELQRRSDLLSEAGVVFTPGLNEELAATAVAGTQLLGELPGRRHDGVTGFWYGKNPGLDRAADAIRHGNYSGTAPLGGAVALVGDDPMCKSSTLPSSCEQLMKSLLVPLLTPSSVAELLTSGLHAVALSRYAGTWTAVKVVADLADGAATVDLADPASFIPMPETGREMHEPILVGPQSLDAERRLLAFRLPRVGEYAHHSGLNRVCFEPRRPRRAVVAPGLPFAAVLRALADLGLGEADREALGLRLVQIGLSWPIEPVHLRELVAGVDEVLVIEDKSAFVESQLKEALYRQPHQPVVVGRTDEVGRPLVPAVGAVTSEAVVTVLAARLGEELPAPARARLEHLRRRVPGERLVLRPSPVSTDEQGDAPLPARTPYFCSGCPHNISTRADDDQLVGLGIGCHIMVALDDAGRGHHVGMTQMGGEGAQWIGLAPFTDDPHYFQNLGDGTFFHSGSLAVRAAIAADVNLTYKLLFNNAVAMTGGQPPQGEMSVRAVVDWLASQGVRKVVVTTADPRRYRRIRLHPVAEVRRREDLPAIQRELARTPGVTVLLHDDWCAAERRRLRKRGRLPTPAERVWINERVCEGCGDCVDKSSCLSLVPVETAFGRKTAIQQGSCNQDFSCIGGDCPSFVEVFAHPRPRASPEPPGPLPEPERRVPDDVVIRMPGIGGTGVVTVSRVLQMAAHLAGRRAAGVEQTGLAQKGGPVISDVRLATDPVEGSVPAGPRSADVLLGFDGLGAAAPSNLAVCDPDRTVAVVNTARVPTAAMVRDRSSHYPDDVADRIERVVRPGESAYLDTDWIAGRLSDDHLATNMALLGAAYQHGCLPVPATAIEAAIALNGVSVDENLRAFRFGRAAVVDENAVRRALSPAATPPVPTTTLAELVAARSADLVAYQDRHYARRYEEAVAAVAAVEDERAPDAGHPVALAFARGLYKLMAYKDEYEVARLHLDPVERARLTDEFGAGTRTKVLLRPPLLTRFGLRRKIRLGSSAGPAFRALRAGRRLRGTRLDPFGRTTVRRLERRLPAEYRAVVEAALSRLTPATAGKVTEVAELPDLVRGYEQVKLAGVESFRSRADELLAGLDAA